MFFILKLTLLLALSARSGTTSCVVHFKTSIRELHPCLQECRGSRELLSTSKHVFKIATDACCRCLPNSVTKLRPDIEIKRANWAIDRINQETPTLDMNTFQFEGPNQVPIYIIDGPVMYSHSEIGNRVITIGDTSGTPPEEDQSAPECTLHGTSVSSMLIGKTVGVWRDGVVFHVNAFGCHENANIVNVIEAIALIQEHRGLHGGDELAAIINLSFGLERVDELNEVFDDLFEDDNMMFVASAGNDAQDACGQSPSSASRVFSIASIAKDTDLISQFSNFGPCVTLLAPGQGLIGAHTQSASSFGLFSGTSHAAPIVSGILAGYSEVVHGAGAFKIGADEVTTSHLFVTTVRGQPNDTPNQLSTVYKFTTPTVEPSASQSGSSIEFTQTPGNASKFKAMTTLKIVTILQFLFL